MNFLEKTISYISPNYALERQRTFMKLKMIERAFAAASKSKRLKNWVVDHTSINEQTLKSLDVLRARSRDLVQNDGYSQRAITGIQNNTVGTGITADITRNGNTDNRIQDLWQDFAESTKCDAEGTSDFNGIQSLMMREIPEAGECFIRKFPKKFKKGEIPFEIKIIEPELIDSTKNTTDQVNSNDTNVIAQGINFNNRGKRIGFYIKNGYSNSWKNNSYYVDASEILHCFRKDRAGQARGIPWLAPVMIDLKDLIEFQEAELVRRKIASCFTAFIHDIDGINSGDAEDEKDLQGENMEPGTYEYLPPGKTITLSNPPVGGGFNEFCNPILKKIAVGVGVTYEILTSDLSQVNFSSGRMGWLEFQRNLESWRWNMLIPMLCKPVFQWFLESLENVYGIDTNGVKVTWTPPRREMIDPLKEIKAESLSVRNGFKSIDEVHREFGYNSYATLQKIKLNNDVIDKFKITLDSDPRKTTPLGGNKSKNG